MASAITYRFALKEDILKLRGLYENVFQRSFGVKALEWRFMQNPLLREVYYNYIAFNSKGNIVGHTGFIPMDYVNGDDLLRGAISVGSAVLKEYAGIFPKLYKELEKQLAADNVDFLFAFPNATSLPFFLKYFQYQQHFFNYLQLEVSEIANPDENVLCAHVAEGISNRLAKDFLQWRIYACPLNTYETFENSNITITYKRYTHDEIDLLCLDFKEEYFSLASFRDFLIGIEKVRKINVYSTNQLFSSVLMKLGFKEILVGNSCVYKILGPSLTKHKLFLQMIDSDVF